jgi:hypothetical protein
MPAWWDAGAIGMVSAAKDTRLTAEIKLICKIRMRVETGVRAGIKLIGQ